MSPARSYFLASVFIYLYQGSVNIKRPFVFINAAMSADGKISTKEKRQVRISGDIDFDRMDQLRFSADAILVGIGTVLADDPSLTVKALKRRETRRASGLDEDPLRIIIDSKARTPLNADIFKKGNGKHMVVVSNAAPESRVKGLSKKTDVFICGDKKVDLERLMSELYSRGMRKVMLEGGSGLNWGMLSSGLVDEVYTFIGPLIIGGLDAPTLVDGDGYTMNELLPLTLLSVVPMGEGVLLKWAVGP